MGSKLFGFKSYGSIPHLPGSRLGPGDHHCTEGQAQIATVKTRDLHDYVVVQEKVDGSNVAIARVGNTIYPLTRAGYSAWSSPYEQHRMFAVWVNQQLTRWLDFLGVGERLCGEWMAQAHGTIYRDLPEPFLAFDIMRGHDRAGWLEFKDRIERSDICTVYTIHQGGAFPVEQAMAQLGGHGRFGAIGGPEGVVYRVLRHGKYDFLAKYVRPDKKDGAYLPEVSGGEAVWNWAE